MISIIISTYQPHYLNELRKNIASTIGVAYEIIAVDNYGAMSICKAYNTGAAKAKFPILCFMHEDVLFRTNNWGNLLLNHFEEDPKIGLIGVAGGLYKSAAPSPWFPWVHTDAYDRIATMNIRQPGSEDKMTLHYINSSNAIRTRVAVADGVCLYCKKEIWSKTKFDEKLLKGFHGYDLDFSLAVQKYAQVFVIFDILIEHFSLGKYEMQWVKATFDLHRKWRWKLPVNYSIIGNEELIKYERDGREGFIRLMYQFNFTPLSILSIIWGVGSFRFFHPGKFLLWNRNWLKYVKAYASKKGA